jgi:hypothetical protein
VPTELPEGLAARAHRATDSLHAVIYFVPEAEQEFTGIGLRPGRMGYFASRAAPMGPVSAGVVAATFYNFNPAIVERHIPRAWGLASTDEILAARLRVADRTLRRILGDEVARTPAVKELADLAREAVAGLPLDGRPLFAAHAGLGWPDEPHLVMWHAVTLLREFRGDGHVAALLTAGMSGLDALITHTATGRGFTEAAAKSTRGWSAEEWDAGVQRLREQGLLGDSGLTEEGVRVRESIEAVTDALAAAPWQRLGVEGTQRVIDVGRALSRQLVEGGAFPGEIFARR